MTVFKHQFNDLMKAIVQAGFSPGSFERGKNNMNMTEEHFVLFKDKKPPVNEEGKQPEYFFSVMVCHHDHSLKYRSYPTDEGPVVFGRPAMDWSHVRDEFAKWLELLRKDLDEPDLWDLYQKNAQNALVEVRKQLGLDDLVMASDGMINTDAREALIGSLQQVVDQLTSHLNGNNAAMERIAVAVEAINESTRKRPKSAILTAFTFLGTLVVTECAKDVAKDINGEIKNLLASIINP